MVKPLMARATAVWLVDNTTLSFKQIGDFVSMHELEIQGIADGDVALGVKGFDPVANNQLDLDEIKKGEGDPLHKLKLKFNPAAVGEEKRRGPRYTPLSKRADKPNGIYWFIKNLPEIPDSKICKIIGTTKKTVQSIRDRSYWNIQNIRAQNPFELGLCDKEDIEAIIDKYRNKD